MIRRSITWMLLAGVVASALPIEIAASQQQETQAQFTADTSGVPCSEHGPAGDPCEDGCLCPCCTAHTLPPNAQAILRLTVIPSQGLPQAPALELYQGDFDTGLFRPPRRS